MMMMMNAEAESGTVCSRNGLVSPAVTPTDSKSSSTSMAGTCKSFEIRRTGYMIRLPHPGDLDF
jgi:hypothetical protein